ncbi:MAG: hypothetical protein ACT4P6_05980 [Gemmatimonadaceae bacterium]
MPARRSHSSNRTSHTLFGVDDGTFHAREIVWQRVGRVALALFIFGGFVGFFGAGPLSEATTRSPDGTTELQYERWTRGHASTELRLRTSAVADRGALRLWMNKEFAEAIDIQQIVPVAERSSSSAERVEFRILAPQDSTLEVIVRYQPLQIGFKSVTIGLGNSAPLRIRQVVFP